MPEPTQAVDPTTTQGLTPATETPSTTTTPGAQDDGKDKEPTQPGAAEKVSELPEWAQAEIKSLRKEAADRRKAASDAAEAARKTEEATLATQQKWEELAKKRGGELDALKPKAELADQLTELVLTQYDAAIKDWPEQVRAMAPADEADILSKLTWLEKAKPLATELMEDKTPTPGNGRGPRPAGPPRDKAADEQRAQWQRQAARRYK